MEFAGKLILPMDIKPDPSRRCAHECWLRASKSGEEDGKKTRDKAQTTKSSEAKNHPAQSSLTPPVTTAGPHRHVDQLNGAPPRPTLPIGPATSNWR